jgi:hypothetical protein
MSRRACTLLTAFVAALVMSLAGAVATAPATARGYDATVESSPAERPAVGASQAAPELTGITTAGRPDPSAAGFMYDARLNARVDTQHAFALPTASSLVSEVCLRTALRSVVVRHTCMTADAAWNATEADGYLYRGVHEGHPGTANALEGRADPWGGHSDPALHNGGVNQSEFTSWTRDPGIAFDCATECNGPGVVLRIPDADGPGFTRVPSRDIYGESEVLIRRPVAGADVYDGWDFGETWGFNGQR